MSFVDYWKSLKFSEHRLAWAVAIGADALQILAFPLFVEGGISPADSVLDLVVAIALTHLLGWHWAFLPSLAAEADSRTRPFSDLDGGGVVRHAPTSTSTEPEILPPRSCARAASSN